MPVDSCFWWSHQPRTAGLVSWSLQLIHHIPPSSFINWGLKNNVAERNNWHSIDKKQHCSASQDVCVLKHHMYWIRNNIYITILNYIILDIYNWIFHSSYVYTLTIMHIWFSIHYPVFFSVDSPHHRGERGPRPPRPHPHWDTSVSWLWLWSWLWFYDYDYHYSTAIVIIIIIIVIFSIIIIIISLLSFFFLSLFLRFLYIYIYLHTSYTHIRPWCPSSGPPGLAKMVRNQSIKNLRTRTDMKCLKSL
jgi:hypothetical protein